MSVAGEWRRGWLFVLLTAIGLTCAPNIGGATGMELDMLAFLTARYFGLRDFARIYGRLYTFLAAPAGLAPLAFGFLWDATGSYRMPFLLASGCLVASTAALLTLGRYPAILPGAD